MITLEKILGALTGKENLYRCGRNFTAIEQALNNVGGGTAADTSYDNTESGMLATDVQAAVDELRAQNNSFAPHLSDLITDADGAHGLKVEYGTWTPVLVGSTVAGAHTYARQKGSYTRIGNEVTLYFDISIAAAGLDAAMAGNLQIIGLPFISSNAARARSVFEFNNLTLGANYYNVIAGINESTNAIIFLRYGVGVSGNYLTKDQLTSGQAVLFTGSLTYKI